MILVLEWCKSIFLFIYFVNHFDEDMHEDFYIFIPSDLDLWPLDLKFASLVTLV